MQSVLEEGFCEAGDAVLHPVNTQEETEHGATRGHTHTHILTDFSMLTH